MGVKTALTSLSLRHKEFKYNLNKLSRIVMHTDTDQLVKQWLIDNFKLKDSSTTTVNAKTMVSHS